MKVEKSDVTYKTMIEKEVDVIRRSDYIRQATLKLLEAHSQQTFARPLLRRNISLSLSLSLSLTLIPCHDETW